MQFQGWVGAITVPGLSRNISNSRIEQEQLHFQGRVEANAIPGLGRSNYGSRVE
jgi:hypothetical protein